MKKTALALAAAATALTMTSTAAPAGAAVAPVTTRSAHAEAPTRAGDPDLASLTGLSAAQVKAGYRDLVGAMVADGGSVAGGVVTYQLKGYGPVQLAVPAAQNDLGGGWDGWKGPYVSFNRTDQGALLAGGGAALAAAICLIPAVGQAACVVAAALVAIAIYYVDAYGKCPTSKPNLRVYVWSRSRGCYS